MDTVYTDTHCIHECKEEDPYPPESSWTSANGAPLIIVQKSRPSAKKRPAPAPQRVKVESDDEDRDITI